MHTSKGEGACGHPETAADVIAVLVVAKWTVDLCNKSGGVTVLCADVDDALRTGHMVGWTLRPWLADGLPPPWLVAMM